MFANPSLIAAIESQKSTRNGDWFQTYSGIQFYPLDPRPEDICIDDIAHALARTCRFGGHTTDFYSVAQHSVMVSHIVQPELAFVGLMHDATEAYCGDVVQPLKYALPDYLNIEDCIWEAVAARFNLPAFISQEVKHADNVALVTERRDLIQHQRQWGEWTRAYTPLENKILPLTPEEAEAVFIIRFNQLIAPN